MSASVLLSLLFLALRPLAASGQVAPLHVERQPMIVETYRQALGRDPSAQEVFYWEVYQDAPPGIINRQSLFGVLIKTLRNSPAEREATARRALHALFGEAEVSRPLLRRYIDDSSNPPLRRALADLTAERDGGGYRGLVAWLGRPDVRQHFVAHTGITAMLAAGEAAR